MPSVVKGARRIISRHEPIRFVTDGHLNVGVVLAAGTLFEAVLEGGRSLGKFRTALAAAKAVSGAVRDRSVD